WHADLLCIVADDLHILVPDADFHGGVVVFSFHHHRRSQFEHARIARTGFHQIENELRRQASLHAQHHSFGGSDIVDRYQEIGDVFHATAIAEDADVANPAAENLEHGFELAYLLGIAASVKDEVAIFCLCTCAADR